MDPQSVIAALQMGQPTTPAPAGMMNGAPPSAPSPMQTPPPQIPPQQGSLGQTMIDPAQAQAMQQMAMQGMNQPMGGMQNQAQPQADPLLASLMGAQGQ